MSDEQPECGQPTEGDDLVVRATHDRTAFGSLYDRYFSRVWSYCVRRLFNRTIAEDVTSDIFLQVASHIRDFTGHTESDFRRWLFRIATNAINAHLRHSRRRQELWDMAARSRQRDCSSGSHSSTAQSDTLDWPVVYQALLELDERDQTIVTLRFFADCSHEEIADVVKSTPGAVRTALSRTLARLREKFDPVMPPLRGHELSERS